MSSVIELMLKIHKYGKKKFEEKLDQQEMDKKKFEVDIKYFTEWFGQCEKRNRSKFEYFYGPYTQDKDMLENLRKRRSSVASKSSFRVEAGGAPDEAAEPVLPFGSRTAVRGFGSPIKGATTNASAGQNAQNDKGAHQLP